ncbi:hypothetical protein MMC30_008724 [Trapelia coarctata]|nr:hypothetical protein [Trapelia coarctata]
MHIHFATLLGLAALTSYALAAPLEQFKRSIPALQGWSAANFGGTEEYSVFCAPDVECCKVQVFNAQGVLVDVKKPVLSLNLLDAPILLNQKSQAIIYFTDDCSGLPINVFSAFQGNKDLFCPATIGSFKFITNPLDTHVSTSGACVCH